MNTMKYFFTFIAGAVISGSIVWSLTTTSREKVIELLMVMNETADLRFYSELQKADDSEIKCILAKHAASIASDLSENDAAESAILGPQGLGPVAARNIKRAKKTYESSGADGLSKTCNTQTKLFK